MKLYVYDHCPYCVRAKMIFGLKDLPIKIETLANDDEATPTKLIGKKMVPIMEINGGTYMPESLDIVDYVENKLGGPRVLTGQQNPAITRWLEDSGEYSGKLCMPRFVKLGLEEFQTKSAVDYFTKKKTAYVGDFNELLAKSEGFINKANHHLRQLEQYIVSKEAVNGTLSLDDILLFPKLHGLSCVKGINFPSKVMDYMKTMSAKTKVDLYLNKAI